MIYQAWEEPSRKKRVALAHRALEASANCADAFVLLAEEEAKTGQAERELYQSGVEAGRRALGEGFFQDEKNVGHFWGLLETRPFMRALAGLAGVQWHLGQRDEALASQQELLRLNPNDNQGIRYLLLRHLLELGRDDQARLLLKSYHDDGAAEWAYSEALLAFRCSGESGAANRALARALEANRHVPAYLSGKKRIPLHLPDALSPGREDEAVDYAAAALQVWRVTPGALDWLRRQALTP